MDTTGSLIVCKNDESHVFIAGADQGTFREPALPRHRIRCGERGGGVTVNAPIGRHQSSARKWRSMRKTASLPSPITKVLERFERYTYMGLNWRPGAPIRSACTWQALVIRCWRHAVFQRKSPYKLQGQTLHAMTIGFIHPRTREYMEVTAPLPEYFEKILKNLR